MPRQHMTPAEATAAGLFPRSILRRDYRLKPGKGQQSAGTVWQGQGSYRVFAKADCIPLRPRREPTPAQLAALAAGRELAGTVQCVGCGQRFLPEEMGIMRAGRHIMKRHCEECIHEGCLTVARATAAGWLTDNPLFLDTETTGLGDSDQIAEIAVLDQAGAILFQSLVNPSCPMAPEAAAVNGITEAEIATAPTWPLVFAQVATLIEGRTIICHSSDFDKRMVQQTCVAYGLSAPAVNWRCTKELLADGNGGRWPSLADAMNLVAATWPEFGKAHRASYDADLCRRVVLALATAHAGQQPVNSGDDEK